MQLLGNEKLSLTRYTFPVQTLIGSIPLNAFPGRKILYSNYMHISMSYALYVKISLHAILTPHKNTHVFHGTRLLIHPLYRVIGWFRRSFYHFLWEDGVFLQDCQKESWPAQERFGHCFWSSVGQSKIFAKYDSLHMLSDNSIILKNVIASIFTVSLLSWDLKNLCWLD